MRDLSAPEPPPIPLDYDVKCEVALTAEQQRIVQEETGRSMDVLVLEDSQGLYARRMDTYEPETFTLLAIKQARLLNDYDEAYASYLEELDAYLKGQTEADPLDAMAEAASVAALQEAERLKLFFMKEAEACQSARQIAQIEYRK